MAGLDTIDPANPCLSLFGLSSSVSLRSALPLLTAGWTSNVVENCGRELDEKIPADGEYAFHAATEVPGRTRVLTS
jgi:hypothetical protein